MFAVEERLCERKISLDCHDECHTAGAHAKKTPRHSHDAEHFSVLLLETVTWHLMSDGHLC